MLFYFYTSILFIWTSYEQLRQLMGILEASGVLPSRFFPVYNFFKSFPSPGGGGGGQDLYKSEEGGVGKEGQY